MEETISSCPTTYEKFSIEKLLEVYRLGAPKLAYLATGLQTEVLRAKPIENKWSIQEIIFHLLDAEMLGLIRMRMLIAEYNKTLPCYDQDKWAIAMDYNSRTENDVHEAIRSFYILRDNNAIMLEALPLQTWAKRAIHPEYESISLRNLLEIYTDHSERHLEQIMERLKLLGVEKNVEIDLKERLY